LATEKERKGEAKVLRHFRKYISLLLAAVMLLGCLGLSPSARAEEDAETQETPETDMGPPPVGEIPYEEDPEEEELPEEELDPSKLPVWKKIPHYFQTDYPNTMFGPGTLEKNGCSITCLAMVASYMTGHDYYPDELARYFGGKAQNNMARMEYGAETMKIPYFKSPNYHVTMDALRSGKIAIALMNKKSLFTDSQHFIVLAGINEEGRVMVLDPYEPNYLKWNLVDGFENGFHPDDILYGYSGAWIFNINDMPKEPYIYHEEERDYTQSRYPNFQLNDEDLVLLAKLIWLEARGEEFPGQQAIAEIVFNRMADPRFPSTVRGVIFAEGQFRTTKKLEKAKPNQTQYDAILDALYGPNILPMDVFYFGTVPMTDNVWGRIGGHIFCYE